MKSKNNIITLSSAQSAHNIVSVKDNMVLQKQVNTFTAHQQFSVWIGAKKKKKKKKTIPEQITMLFFFSQVSADIQTQTGMCSQRLIGNIRSRKLV